MKEYFVSVIAVTLAGSALIALAPNGGFIKNIKLLCALCTVACIAFPIGSIFSDGVSANDIKEAFDVQLDEERNYDEIYNNSINEYELLNAEMTLKNEIAQVFELDSDALDVKLVMGEENGTLYISLVKFYLHSKGLTADPRALETYVLERLGCGCEFVYDIL